MDCERPLMGLGSRRSHTSRHGLSLLEILVVVAILALLFSVLLPSVLKARATARRLTCATHLRAFGHALTLYRSNSGRYPPVSWYPLSPDAVRSPDSIGEAAQLLVRYALGRPDAMYCPISLKDDPAAQPPVERVTVGGRVIYLENWRTGQISYIYLSGLTYTFPDENNRPTFSPEIESPDLPKATGVVLAGDRAFVADLPRTAGSNHKKEGGWFYFVGGETIWRERSTLTGHPTGRRSWLWPRLGRRNNDALATP